MVTMGSSKRREDRPDARLLNPEQERGSEVLEGSDIPVRVISALETLFLGACSILLAPFFFVFILQMFIQHSVRDYRTKRGNSHE